MAIIFLVRLYAVVIGLLQNNNYTPGKNIEHVLLNAVQNGRLNGNSVHILIIRTVKLGHAMHK